MNLASKNTVCLWCDGSAEETARFYARTFPDSAVSRCIAHPATTRQASKTMG